MTIVEDPGFRNDFPAFEPAGANAVRPVAAVLPETWRRWSAGHYGVDHRCPECSAMRFTPRRRRVRAA
jgi:hypothetical protein